jgi:hypothetical protein
MAIDVKGCQMFALIRRQVRLHEKSMGGRLTSLNNLGQYASYCPVVPGR